MYARRRHEVILRARIVRIGNSQGIRIPKPLLEQAGLRDEVDLQAEAGRIVIASVRQPRAGWADAARRLHDVGADALESTGATDFDRAEWEWR